MSRCGRCLVKVSPATFLHDCAGAGLGADHYVSRLEAELGRLGMWLTQNTSAEGGVAAVDGAIALIKRLELRFLATEAPPNHSDAVGQGEQPTSAGTIMDKRREGSRVLKPEEIARLQQIKRLVEEILKEPAGELRHSFAEKVLAELCYLCRNHNVTLL